MKLSEVPDSNPMKPLSLIPIPEEAESIVSSVESYYGHRDVKEIDAVFGLKTSQTTVFKRKENRVPIRRQKATLMSPTLDSRTIRIARKANLA